MHQLVSAIQMSMHDIYIYIKVYVVGTFFEIHQLVNAIQMSMYNIYIKVYVVVTHLNCINLSVQFK